MQRVKSIIHLALMTLFSCKQSGQPTTTKILDFKAFTIEVPSSWNKRDLKGIDSYVGDILIDSTDTIGFDIGRFSNSLTEPNPIIWERGYLKEHAGMDNTQVVLVDDHRSAKELDQYRKQNLTWDSIDGYEAKIVYPRKPGFGITGVYIDSLFDTKFGRERFNLYGHNLKPKNQQLFLQAIKTIKFRRSK